MKKIKVNPYEKLALIYNHVMNHVNYKLWVKYIFSISREYIKEDSSILEIACGNGRFSTLFKEYYPNIIICDKSFEMLSSRKNSIPKVCCEMTRLPFRMKYNLIYSTFDSVNYLLNKRDLLIFFREIKSILADKGIFTFDVCLEKNSLVYVKTPERSGTVNEISYHHLSIYNKRTKFHYNIFEIKLKDGKIFKEIHKQKIYPFKLYFELIEKSGLFVIDCYNAFTFKEAKSNSKRAQFVVKKNPNAFIQ